MATKETKTANQTSEVIEPVVAESKTESEPTGWIVSVNNSAAYCGIGAVVSSSQTERQRLHLSVWQIGSWSMTDILLSLRSKAVVI